MAEEHSIRISLPLAAIIALLVPLSTVFSTWLFQDYKMSTVIARQEENVRSDASQDLRITANTMDITIAKENIKSLDKGLCEIKVTVDEIRKDQLVFFKSLREERGKLPYTK